MLKFAEKGVGSSPSGTSRELPERVNALLSNKRTNGKKNSKHNTFVSISVVQQYFLFLFAHIYKKRLVCEQWCKLKTGVAI